MHRMMRWRRPQAAAPSRDEETAQDELTSDTPAFTEQQRLRNIYHTAFLLRQKLVPDVIPLILCHAGLFYRQICSEWYPAEVAVDEHRAPYTCITSAPIQSTARTQRPVRKVVFIIRSRDQGWASSEGSWTWFTAGVIPKMEEDNVEIVDYSPWSKGDRLLSRERSIFQNERASREMKTHIIELTSDSEDEGEREWVDSLQNGDQIIVRAWARFPGWVNHIQSVSIAVHMVAVI